MTVPAAPFPAFGGKATVAAAVWQRVGHGINYVLPTYSGLRQIGGYLEPFGNTLALLLANPLYDWRSGSWLCDPPPIETVNDIDPFISNAWRSIKWQPDETAHYVDWPVNETDLHARHRWLLEHRDRLSRALHGDPHYCDPKVAGWWIWGLSCWIGTGWCDPDREPARSRPHLSNRGQGVHRSRLDVFDRSAATRSEQLRSYFRVLSRRLERVRVCCGDWSRVVQPSVLHKNSSAATLPTVVMLDPPYSAAADRTGGLYASDSQSVANDVRDWALSNGDNPMLRIVLFGYEREHDMPDNWACLAWRPRKGLMSATNDNVSQERVWFSPHCRAEAEPELPLLRSL